jgi:hypothetical protein
MSRLQVLVPDDLSRQIEKAAERSRMSKGAWVRRVIERELQCSRRDSDPVARLASLDAPTADLEQMLREIEDERR